MKYFDDIFDDLYLRQLSQKVIESNCKSNNIAGRHTWPYGHKGNHKIMGSTLFERHKLRPSKLRISKSVDRPSVSNRYANETTTCIAIDFY
jgi:hypothetical protein